MAVLEFRNVSKGFGTGTDRSEVLKNIDLSVEDGEFVVLLGFSGTGKTTLINLMAGLTMPSEGEVVFKGKPITGPGPERGVVFQRYSVFPHMTVRENILAGEGFATGWGKLFGAKRKAANERADQMLARIGLNHVADQYPASLSGGMQQRLAIGQALTAKPRVLLLDEPFGALDPGTRLQMHDFLMELKAETGMTVFMVSHDLEEAFKLGDRVLVFDKPRWDPVDPGLYGATITYDFDARDKGIPFQNILDQYPSLVPA